jgi:hypothetical protein
VENIFGVKTERLLQKCFNAIKFHNTQMRFETTRDMLESKIPERDALEYQKQALAKTMDTKAKVTAMRFLYNMGCGTKRDAL